MSQVKFILLGTNVEPKKNYLVDGENEYKAFLNLAIADHPGAVIFTTFINSVGGKPTNEIYANGLLYSAGGGSGSGAVYYGTVAVDTDGQIANFSTEHDGAEPETGNVYIYDPENSSSKTPGGNIADCTAYYYNGEKWFAFTGNVNAENVWFPNGFLRNLAWGCIGKTTTGEVTIDKEIKNKNLKEVLEYYLVSEMWPAPTSGHTGIPRFSVTPGEVMVSPNSVTLTYNDSQTVTVRYTAPTTATVNSNPYTPLSYIRDMTYGYKNTLDGEKIGATSKTASGETVTATISKPTRGNIKVGVITNGTLDSTKSNTATPSSTTTSVTYTYTVPTNSVTSSGGATVTFGSGGDYATNFSCSWKNTENATVTSATCPSISTIYYLNNKGETKSNKTASISELELTLPSSPTHTHLTKTLTYKVGYPVYFRYRTSSSAAWSYTEMGTYYSNVKTFTIDELPQAIDPGTYSLSLILIPSISSINATGKLLINDLVNNNYSYDSKSSVSYNNLSFRLITFKDTMAAASKAKLKITLN